MVTLRGERLTLRPWTVEDAVEAYAIYSNAEVVRYLGRAPMESVEAQRERLREVLARYAEWNGPYGFWAIETVSRIVGTAIFKPLPGHPEVEIGWHLARESWGNGYATEAGRLMIEYAFGLGTIDRLVAVVNPENQRSAAVARRLGMKYEGRIRAYEEDVDLFALDRSHP